jgi:hypothetical protein
MRSPAPTPVAAITIPGPIVLIELKLSVLIGRLYRLENQTRWLDQHHYLVEALNNSIMESSEHEKK